MKTKFSFLAVFILISNLLFAQDFKVISSNATSLVVEYNPVYTDTTLKKTDSGEFLGVNILNAVYDKNIKPGAPLLPARLINIGVPQEFGNTIQIVDTKYITVNGRPAPKPSISIENGEKAEKLSVDEGLYSSFQNQDFVIFDEFGFVRDLPVQTLRISPVQYIPASNEIRYYTRIVFRVNFASPLQNAQLIKESFLANAVINFDAAKYWGKGKDKLYKLAPQPSVLASGKWVRFEIKDEGIYKIDYSTLSNLGFNPSTIDPRTIKIYNNGGYQLPETPSAARPVDLVENAITVAGQDDGVFNNSDYILFYGRGVDFWEPKTFKIWNGTGDSITVTRVLRVKHQFSKKNYYYITAGGNAGKRMQLKNPSTAAPDVVQQTTKAYLFKEDDSKNIYESGRLYFGDMFSASTSRGQTYTNTLNELIPGSKINYTLSLVNINTSFDSPSAKGLHFQISESNNLILSDQIDFPFTAYGYGGIETKYASYTGTLADNRSNLKIYFDGLDNASKSAYLNFFEIEYNRNLRAVSDNITFFSNDTTGVNEFRLSNFSNSLIEVYDVSDYANVKKVYLQPNINISGGDCTFSFNSVKGEIDKYIALTTASYKTIPSAKEDVTNSNYRGELTGAEYLIISPASFQTEAEDLRNYRANLSPDKKSSLVFLLPSIFNEFSGGLFDPSAIRDFLKYAYDNWTIKPKYVLLFGDGTYDSYGVTTNGTAKNLIPTMQTVESLDEVESYPIEDYFARISGDDKKVDIAVGRINAQNEDEAKNAVDKIKNYEAMNEADKNWRSTITLVADDAFPLHNYDYSLHTDQSEQLANQFIPKTFNLNKIYLAAYPTSITSGGRRKPAVNQAILDAMNNGTLILSYIGHGAPNIWADELVLETTSTNFLQNTKFYFLTAATCDFGRFDAGSEDCGAEKMLVAKDAGSVGALAASRPTYPGPNFELNSFFYNSLLTYRDTDGKPVSIGEAYMLTKQHGSSYISNDERYLLFGDPGLRLKIPQLPVSIDSVNGISTNVVSQVRALDKVRLNGTIYNTDKTKSNYSGEALISVFDSEKDVAIQGQDGDPSVYNVKYQGGLIYRGKVTVSNGIYSTDFMVPKDISYENKNGKIVTYVYNTQNDGVGYTDNFTVGGTNTSAVNDGKGPKVDVYFDNLNSSDSYLVNTNFTMYVKLKDDTGLNTTGVGLGHKLEAVLNDNESSPIDLTNYFVGDLDSGGKSGMITYSFSNFTPGEYKIKIKAWDVFNNSSVTDAYFTVVESNTLVIKNVVNYPNPFSSNTTFTFQHNLSKPINARIKIYTVAGRLIKQLENTNIIDKFVRIDWDGRDEDGNAIANGTYLYKLIVETVDKEFAQDVLGKLSVIR